MLKKICLNSSVLDNENIIKDFSKNFGSQSIVVSVDVKKDFFNNYLIYNNQKKKILKKIKTE